MQRTAQVLQFLFLVALAVVLASCAPAATPVPAQAAAAAPMAAPASAEATAVTPTFTGEPIRLGLQAPLSGPHAPEGLAIKQAVALMAQQTNAAGGIDGREVILGANPAEASTPARESRHGFAQSCT